MTLPRDPGLATARLHFYASLSSARAIRIERLAIISSQAQTETLRARDGPCGVDRIAKMLFQIWNRKVVRYD